MANKPFDYTIINPLERPTSKDINQLQAQAHYDSRVLADKLFAGAEGFLGDSFKAVPTDPNSNTFTLTGGVLYTLGVDESNIGGIDGLSDSYTYKATYQGTRTINLASYPPPTTAPKVRYDLIEIRALTGTERKTNPQTVDILNPALKTFTPQPSVDKTLTAALDGFELAPATQGGATPTAAIVYKTGTEEDYPGNWDDVIRPTVDTGYRAVVYIRRFVGQTSVDAAQLVDGRTLLTVPVQSGGTGNNEAATYTGSVAWFDTADGKLKYTQATLGAPFYVPASGYLLASNSVGAPEWVGYGTEGQILTSTGTGWEAQARYVYQAVSMGSGVPEYTNATASWTEITALTLEDIDLRAGVLHLTMQPIATTESDYCIRANVQSAAVDQVYLKFEVTGATSRTRIFPYQLGSYTSATLPFPIAALLVNKGTHTVKVYGKAAVSGGDESTIYVKSCQLVATQG